MAAVPEEKSCASNTTEEVFDIVIVGGGLSGLFVARGLESDITPSPSWVLLEANEEHFGGRLRNSKSGVDMGAAWAWPRAQPLITQLLKSLKIDTFQQPGGDSMTERVVGGTVSMVNAIVESLPTDKLRLNWPVSQCILEQTSGQIILSNHQGMRIRAKRGVILAVPPKLLINRVQFSPSLSQPRIRAMQQADTWMAGVTKVALNFNERFWPVDAADMGLRQGGPNRPGFQVYDSGPLDGASHGALTFFTLAPLKDSYDEQADSELSLHCAEQIAEVWGSIGLRQEALKIVSDTKNAAACNAEVQRWPLEPFIADDSSPRSIKPHPSPVRALAMPEWDGRLIFASTESDQSSPGVMEGAIGAGIAALKVIKKLLKS